MTISPQEVASRIRQCPSCGTSHYSVEMTTSARPRVKAIRCAECGCDIVAAYHKADPRPFWMRTHELDRLIFIVGGLLLAALALRAIIPSN